MVDRNNDASRKMPTYEGWSLLVEQCGRVEHADIRSAPFVLLVGQNNTGKTYVASLLWALGDLGASIGNVKNSLPSDILNKITAALTHKEPQTVKLDIAAIDRIIKSFNVYIKTMKPSFYERVFALPGYNCNKIEIVNTKVKPLTLSFSRRKASFDTKDSKRSFSVLNVSLKAGAEPTLNAVDEISFSADGDSISTFVTDYVCRMVVTGALFNDVRLASNAYIPAARTGLMLALRSLYSELIRGISPRNPTENAAVRTSLPLPTNNFLLGVTRGGPHLPSGEHSDIADWLEQHLLKGKVEAGREGEAPSFTYSPDKSDLRLPLHATSSMVTELVPFLIALRQSNGLKQLVFEEPEAHLHLSAQRLMARAIAKLVNRGVQMVVTTHSDTFLQQINNLMQIYGSPDRDNLIRELGYDLSDLLNPASIKGYEFVLTGNSTRVVELDQVPEGLVVPSLNKILSDLAEETYRVQESE